MWTRALLKQNAKQALSGRYLRAVLVCLAVGLLGGGSGSGIQLNFGGSTVETLLEQLSYNAALMVLLAVLVILLLAFVLNTFVGGPLEVGMKRYFMENRQGMTPFGTVLTIFQPPYMNVVKVKFLVNLKIALGSLLIIPGLYWAYCYAMVPYLLAENPYLDAHRAMELSHGMMYGDKFNYFVLELSFLGWQLLAGLTIVGGIFLSPYQQATFAEFYAAMRSKAFAAGITGQDELGGFVRHE